MKKLYVVGNPVSHSKSPDIHNYWIQKYSLFAEYQKLQIKEKEIPATLNKLKTGEVEGLNITIPFKKIVLPYLDQLEPSAQKSLAVNTVFKKGNRIVGANTDGRGFFRSIEEDLKINLKPNFNVFCLGAGGAAYGIISELVNHNPYKIWISNRTLTKAKKLVSHFKKLHPNINFSVYPWGESPGSLANLLINTTSAGMNKNDTIDLHLNALPLDSLVYDIIYNPSKTILMKKADERNLRNVNGSYMLVRQAAESFEKWFSVELTTDDIQGALEIIK